MSVKLTNEMRDFLRQFDGDSWLNTITKLRTKFSLTAEEAGTILAEYTEANRVNTGVQTESELTGHHIARQEYVEMEIRDLLSKLVPKRFLKTEIHDGDWSPELLGELRDLIERTIADMLDIKPDQTLDFAMAFYPYLIQLGDRVQVLAVAAHLLEQQQRQIIGMSGIVVAIKGTEITFERDFGERETVLSEMLTVRERPTEYFSEDADDDPANRYFALSSGRTFLINNGTLTWDWDKQGNAY